MALDVLSAVLGELRLTSVAYRLLELGAPFRLGFDQQGVRGVHIVLRGSCELWMKGTRPLALEAGDLVLAPRADPHVLCSAGGKHLALLSTRELASKADGGRIRAGGSGAPTVVLCGAFFFEEVDHPALAAMPRILHVPGAAGRAPGWLPAYIDALSAEVLAAGPGSELVTARLSDAIVARALRHHVEQAGARGWLRGLRDPHVAKALSALHDDLTRPWTLVSLARAAGLSRAAFAARFAHHVGETPMRYLLACRMRRAITLLRDQRATLARVATAVGYGSEAALSAAFKRHTGVSPGAYARGAELRGKSDTRTARRTEPQNGTIS
jgi:AraC-like DNA-binding protein/mannose-6-phosphate isomerase-like protein (cupin superfamily)